MAKKPPIEDKIGPDDGLTPLNSTQILKESLAVAIQSGDDFGDIPRIVASGRGKIAEQILQLAYEQGVKVRQDEDLAEILARIDLDSPIPSEAFLAIAEILSYVFRANQEPNPFDAILGDILAEWDEKAEDSVPVKSMKEDT